jgi:hypothetical protein
VTYPYATISPPPILPNNGPQSHRALNPVHFGNNRINGATFDTRPPYRWEDERNGTIQPVAWRPEQRDFLVRADCGGRFVLVEQFYPGWIAAVDGHPVGIERWGGAFQAIPVPAGDHRITFEFRPRSLRIGAAISWFAGVGLLLLVVADGLSRRHPGKRAG